MIALPSDNQPENTPENYEMQWENSARMFGFLQGYQALAGCISGRLPEARHTARPSLCSTFMSLKNRHLNVVRG
jgi:hypothetical protein